MTTSLCANPTVDGRTCTHVVDDTTRLCAAGHPNPRFRGPTAAAEHVGGGGAAAVADIDDLASSSSNHPGLEATHRVIELDDGRRREEWLDADGVLHRADGGPALLDENGNQGWYRHGDLHREDGPAVVYADGMQAWYQHDRRHRDDGPALVSADSTSQFWYRRGRRHRDDGPAVVTPGHSEWWVDGNLVRTEDTPAPAAS